MPNRTVHPGLEYFLPLISILILSCATATLSQSTATKQTTEPASSQTVLEFEKSVEREIAGGEKHVFRVSLAEGEFAVVTVEQLGIDLSERLFALDGKPTVDFDSSLRNTGTDKIRIVAVAGGDHRIEIEPKFKGDKGKYRITFSVRRPGTEKDRALFESDALYTECVRLSRSGKSKEALEKAERVLSVREKFSDPGSGEVATALNRIGMLYFDLGDNQTSKEYLIKAIKDYESQLPADPLQIATVQNNLGIIYRLSGDLREADSMFTRSLQIKEMELGPDHNSVALTLNNLGVLYRNRGDNIRAETTYLRALGIREKALGKEHPDITRILQNLGAVAFYRGDYDSALAYDQRAVDILTKALGPDHIQTVRSLTTLAQVYLEVGDFAAAEPLLTKGLPILRKGLNEGHQEVATITFDMARVHEGKRDLAAARTNYEKAVEIAEKNAASDPFDLASFLHGYGVFLAEQGELEEAEKRLRRAFEIRQGLLGDTNPAVGKTASRLARVYAQKGDLRNALNFQSLAVAAAEANIELNLSTGSERQKLAYLEYLADDLSQAIAIDAMLDEGNTAARDLALTAILQRKGRVLDAMVNSIARLRERSLPEVRALLEGLNDTNALLSQLMIDGPKNAADTAYQKRVEVLRAQQARYQTEIGRQMGGSFQATRSLSVAEVKQLLPPDAALVEFALFSPLGPKTAGEERYAAYILRKGAATKWIDLGPRAAIDGMVDSLRSSMRQPSRSDIRKLARDVDKAVMEPIRSLAGSPTRFLLSTEGALSLVPFEAFFDENGRFLIERYSISYISSSRDLRRLDASNSAGTAPMVIANPDFGNRFPDASASLSSKNVAPSARRRSITNTRNLSDTYFAPLSGTETEGRSIVEIFPNAKLISGAGATETAVKDVAAPEILHIATHGFFLEDAGASPASRRGAEASIKAAGLIRDNPLLRSGLAFAGANRRTEGKDDGILTALEASGLNLWGTKLVVLSACDTGLGEIRNREGVYGLRRSFAIAGAESLVMSLWPVSDLVTKELMTGYYANLKKGLGRGEALRQVQLSMIKRPTRKHPFYWASFIHSGEWANLDGKR